MGDETTAKVCGAPDFRIGCGREIAEGESFRWVQRVERSVAMGNLDQVRLIDVDPPYTFHSECVPRSNPMWRILPD